MTSNGAAMSNVEHLGRLVELPILRIVSPGAILGGHEAEVLLPGKEIPEGAKDGDLVEVFVYLDSEDRPIATTRAPLLVLGEVTFLTVVDVTSFGAFFDYGLDKHLLVPKGEQTRDLSVGDREPIGLFIDDTGRLAGTMRVSELLHNNFELTLDEWVEGEAWRKDPEIGVFIIVERSFVGLLPRHEPHQLARGEAGRFRVTRIHPDGRFELSLRAAAHEQLEDDAATILSVLARPNAPRFGDRSSPDELRELFGLSKKAFKRALGGLLKRGEVTVDDAGWVRKQ